jgi:alkaline phosphatase
MNFPFDSQVSRFGFSIGVMCLWMVGCKSIEQVSSPVSFVNPNAPRNIILLIGDGMGMAQVSTRFYMNESGQSNFSRFNVIGLHRNSSSSHRVTDSAAGATAFSCGVKTYNGAIGVDAEGKPVETILERLAKQGVKTGLVATSSIQHATPASFYAHVPSRGSYEEITRYLVDAPLDFLAAGGKKFFNRRADKLDYFDSLRVRGVVVDTLALNIPTRFDLDKRYAYLLAEDGMPKMQEGRGDFLPDATTAALTCLGAGPKGFFLMVEGSQIDWGGHDNDAEYILAEMADFDRTIGEALDFAEKDGNTLVIVTSDHETGGFSLSAHTKADGKADYNVITPSFSTGNHSAALIPVFAFGPGAGLFMGIYENNELMARMLKALGN